MKNIMILRKSLHLSQEEFGQPFHMSRQTVSHYENDIHPLKVQQALKISHRFRISMDYIYDNTPFPCLIQYYEPMELTNDEFEFLKNFRKSSLLFQKAVEVVLSKYT